MSRQSDLLKAAATALENGDDPFHLNFLSEHDVTFDECMNMADMIAAGARIVAWATENPLAAAKFLESGSAGMAMDAITRALRHVNAKQGG